MRKTTGQKIADAALEWLGTPYVNNAMAKGHGVDCAYLLVAALIGSDMITKDQLQIENYSNEWHLHRSEEKYLKYIQQVADEVHGEPQIGDFLLYQYGRCISHGAVYIGNDKVIHAFVDLGVIFCFTIIEGNQGSAPCIASIRRKGVQLNGIFI